MIDTSEFNSFAATLSTDQLLKLQGALKPQQLKTVFEIVLAVKGGKPVNEASLKAFLSSIDDKQVEAFAKILTGSQLTTLKTLREKIKT